MSKVWFITGASRGFGRIWAEAALKRGDKVVATARDANTLNELVTKYGDGCLALELDVTNRDAVFEKVEEAHRHFNRIDVVLCNAGYGYMGAIEEIVPGEAQKNIDTNFFGTIHVIQAVLPILRAQKNGHILTVSSIGGVVGFPTGGCYNATKFAIEAISESLAGEVAGQGIKVTTIEPGSYATGFTSSMQMAPSMPEYAPVHVAVRAQFAAGGAGDPKATSEALFKLVDSSKPPLRLLLGTRSLPMIKKVYQDRLDSWEEWAEVSNAAQGMAQAKH